MGASELVISKTFIDDDNRELKIDYFVTNGNSQSDGTQGFPVFGIYVQLSVDGKCSDCSEIDDVTPCKETATQMTQLFAKNLVTPVSLKDVVEDFVAAQL